MSDQPRENPFWMVKGGAYYLGRNPKMRSGVVEHRVPVVTVTKTVAARTYYVDIIWIGDHLCAMFRDPQSGNVYAQILE